MPGENNDWIIKQTQGLGEGIAALFGKNKSGGNDQIIFPKTNDNNLPHQAEISVLLKKRQFEEAAKKVISLQYAMNAAEFLQLGNWLCSSINDEHTNINNRSLLINELAQIKNN